MAFLHFRNGPGALREYVNVDVSLVNHKPDRLSFDQAAAIPLASVTIWEALVIRGKMKKGDKVLINGASGGTGTAAVQLAKAFGATVVAVCSSRNAEFVKSLGADEVVDYETTKVYEQYTQQDFDIVLDCAGTYEELWAHEQTLVKRKGVFVRIVSKDHAMDSLVNLALSGSHYLLQSAYSWIRSGPSLHLFTATPSGKVLKQVTHCLVDENGFQPVIDSVYDFSPESVLQAFDKSASHRARGKIVIRVVQE
ncbi:NAD(P)-binding protein [Basidiobolus meristosporus CBS 931.73]|uniref:NAD(P)-binding protein n=1 Tax=Basidiobolus meristosporus CBS 931.73 TaxID=1314790 RepID=A0A1Y1YR17_9FUNG|nr:NAD(P)-binding protein [Basidiobolus meristosporus CBS 931.73]|eukprot:ORY00419.1 NAD(P)-binding protein [Basidiobolus meristosporus CBS 931.73]